MVDLDGEIKLISEYSHGVTRFDNYLVYYRSNDLTTGMVRTKKHNSIEIKDNEKSISFIPNIGYGNSIIGSGYQLTVENDKITAVESLVFPEPLSWEISGLNSVNNISSKIRLRNDVIIYFTEGESRVYRINNNGLSLLAQSASPLKLYVPELTEMKELINFNEELYIHEMATGVNIKIGTYGRPLSNHMVPMTGTELIQYVGLDSKEYLMDTLDLVSYPIFEGVEHKNYLYVKRFTGGYVYHDGMHWPRWEPVDWHIMVNNVELQQVEEILLLRNFYDIEYIYREGTRIYISSWDVGLIYDLALKRIIEQYRTEKVFTDLGNRWYNERWVLKIYPFGGRTYINYERPMGSQSDR
jgi:hypothetical protein